MKCLLRRRKLWPTKVQVRAVGFIASYPIMYDLYSK